MHFSSLKMCSASACAVPKSRERRVVLDSRLAIKNLPNWVSVLFWEISSQPILVRWDMVPGNNDIYVHFRLWGEDSALSMEHKVKLKGLWSSVGQYDFPARYIYMHVRLAEWELVALAPIYGRYDFPAYIYMHVTWNMVPGDDDMYMHMWLQSENRTLNREQKINSNASLIMSGLAFLSSHECTPVFTDAVWIWLIFHLQTWAHM